MDLGTNHMLFYIISGRKMLCGAFGRFDLLGLSLAAFSRMAEMQLCNIQRMNSEGSVFFLFVYSYDSHSLAGQQVNNVFF